MIPIPEFAPRNVDMSPEAIHQRLRDVASLYYLGMTLPSAKRLGTVAEVRERDRLEEEARQRELLVLAVSNQTVSTQTDTPQPETAS
ncbi:MAG: hypothetical protein NTZ32_19835 [Planctomycetales bacterium]|nr:hypothetical protein [Planctomycetales bacterium]